MTMTQSGPVCDVCGIHILPGTSESINPFSVKGIEQTLLCHDRCKPAVEEMTRIKDWKQLPEGPLRDCFAENYGVV